MIPSSVFVVTAALQNKFPLFNKFSKNPCSMPKTWTHVLSTSGCKSNIFTKNFPIRYNVTYPEKIAFSKMLALELLCNSLCGPLPKILESSCLYESNRHQQTRRRGCHGWELQDELFALCGWIYILYCMRGSSQHGLQHAFDRFSAACDQAGKKISTKTIEALCLSRRPRQCVMQVSRNTLQQL